jgi:hypothetical protein
VSKSKCNVAPFADQFLTLAHRASEIDLTLVHAKPNDRRALELELAAIDLRLPKLDDEGARRYANCATSAAFQIGIIRRVLEALRNAELNDMQRRENFDRAERSVKSLLQYVANLKSPDGISTRRGRARTRA